MKRSYSPKQVAVHVLLFPLRLIPRDLLQKHVFRHILKFKNSIPIYLTIRPGDTAVQVGTPNVITMKRFSKYVGKTGKVIIIEAEPDNVSKLKNAAIKNNIHNVTVIGKGAWSSQGQLSLQKSNNYDGDHKFEVEDVIIDNDYRNDETSEVSVNVDTLDNMLSACDSPEIDYLSITVNGAELEVLKGAIKTLKSSRDLTVFSKGHARLGTLENHIPLNSLICDFFKTHEYKPIVTSGEESSTDIAEWDKRDGDVVAWRL